MGKSADNKTTKEHISKKLIIYILILSITASVLMISLFKTYSIDDYVLLVILSVLSIIAETFYILLPKVGAISVSFAITYSAIILTEPLTACIISAVGVALRFPYKDGIGRVHILNDPIYKTLFNKAKNNRILTFSVTS